MDSGDSSDSDALAAVSVRDFEEINFERPIKNEVIIGYHEIASAFQSAARTSQAAQQHKAEAAFSLLGVICSFHMKVENKFEPYGPIAQFDGRRTAIPSDFAGRKSEVFGQLAKQTRNPALRARLADVAWINNKKDGASASLAVTSLVECISLLASKQAILDRDESSPYSHQTEHYLRRALTLGRAIGWKSEAALAARALVQELRALTIMDNSIVGFTRISEIDLDHGISEPTLIALEAEKLALASSHEETRTKSQLWDIAARAFARAKQPQNEARCLIAVAECSVQMADEASFSAMQSTHFLSEAIEHFRRVQRRYRPVGRLEKIQAKLVATQASIADEMGVAMPPIDIREIVENVEGAFQNLSLAEALKQFALLQLPISEETYRAEAIKSVEEHPLASIFAGTMHDHSGKVVAHSPALGFGETNNEEAILFNIARRQELDRALLVQGCIEPARHVIQMEHAVDERHISVIVDRSVFVPSDRRYLYATGFSRMFAGSYMEAAHILVPQVENSLRHLLRLKGVDVSSILEDQTQADATLSVLLERLRPELEKTIDSDLVFEIEMLLQYRGGPNFRNRLAHGLLSGGHFWSAECIFICWFIYQLVSLPLINRWDDVEGELGRRGH